MTRPPTRPGFTLLELLVVLAIVAVLVGLILPAVQRVRAAGARAACGNHLRQLGLALQNFHNDRGRFPVPWAGGDAAHPTLFTSLLPYLEQTNQNPADPQPVPLLFCPARRGPEVGPRSDYGTARHPQYSWDNPVGWLAVLGGWHGTDTPQGIRLGDVAAADGTTATLLVGHKSLAPRDYTAPYDAYRWQADGHWSAEPNQHHRSANYFVRDTNDRLEFQGQSYESSHFIGSAHPAAMPFLFADGSVRPLGYGIDPAHVPRLWAWNDGGAVPLD